MPGRRPIIFIDEDKCNGCGQCITACAEGALALVDGKARLVGEIYCDGLGACLGECPTGALTIIEREAAAFDEDAVQRHLNRNEPPAAHACPSAAAFTLHPAEPRLVGAGESVSSLEHWPVKLQLLQPGAPFLRGADLVLLADCAAAAFPGLHHEILPGKAVAMGCPKLDDLEAHIVRLTDILREAAPRSLTVVHMEVPCCGGFVRAAQEARRRAAVDIPVRHVVITRDGRMLQAEDVE